MDEERGFKGVWIPAEVWLDSRLDALDKVILAEIDSLDKNARGCFASNKHLAEFAQCSESKVSRAVSKLAETGYVRVANFDGRTRILQSSLGNLPRQPRQKSKADSANLQGSINIVSNTDSSTRQDNKERGRFTPPTLDEVTAYCSERKNTVDPEQFLDFYTAKGWKIGAQSMKDWKAAVRTWERRDAPKEVKKKHDFGEYGDSDW